MSAIGKHFQGFDNADRKVLVHGQRIRVTGSEWVHHITFHTIPGCHAKDINSSGGRGSYFYLEHACKAMLKGERYAFAVQSGICITANYPGKAAEIARDKAEHEAAPLLAEGDIVEIDGMPFKVARIQLRCSEPVQFIAEPMRWPEPNYGD